MPIASNPISSLIVDHHPIATTDDEPIDDVDPIDPPDVVMDIPLRSLERARRLPILDDDIVYLQEHEYDMGDLLDPTTYKEAISSPQSNLWIDAMKDEMTSLSQIKVWSLVDLPNGCRPIGCKLMFKTERDAKGQVERYKARLMAKGYS